MSDFHIVVIFNDYFTQIIPFFDQTDAEQKQTCCNPTKSISSLLCHVCHLKDFYRNSFSK